MTRNPPHEPGHRTPRRRSGELEAQVITVLAEADRPLTTGEVMERLADDGLAYSTVVTTLTRLHRKGVAARRRRGRAYRYEAVADAAGLTAYRMNRLLTGEDDRASVLRRFVGALDPGDEEVLRDLLREPDDLP
ncbi:BlaI/MecI/CopY family transcriptional regulator [Spirillospora albida]|uniref:BlaI/MecI/CopY family transcriptional regulator n=1 Tax=Spirillospora albida TaxID=58123 RepID=UPI0004C12FAE|nr:BlaI/MecI/CopY family transcriptional regulator [Spirillospora albida]